MKPDPSQKKGVPKPESISSHPPKTILFSTRELTQKSTKKVDSPWSRGLRLLYRDPKANVGFAGLFLLGLLSLIGPFFTPHYDMQVLSDILLPPSFSHLMGTDHLGRDLLSRVLYGGRLSLMIGFISTLVSMAIGTIYGCISGFFSRHLDMAMMRFVDILYSLPYMFMVIILIFLFGKNLFALFIALGLVQWLTVARVVRGQVLALRNEEFVAAAQVLGVSRLRILFRHIFPNILGIVVIYGTLTVPSVILQEAFLSFLGLNVAPCTWGVLISDGKEYMDTAWWMVVFPGGAITMCLLSLNLLGDSMRDALDPRLS